LTLNPDRIAYYSYAHVPWTSKAQRLFDESNLPSPADKINLYLEGKKLLIAAGYTDIGMDHFALPSDGLHKAWSAGKLHRNFMGYTTHHSGMLLGLGVSAISDTGSSYSQNEKNLHDYYSSIKEKRIPVRKGYFLSGQDIDFRKYIIDISCKGETHFSLTNMETLRSHTFPILRQLEQDGLITWNPKTLRLTPQGRYFVRNICSAFDLYLKKGRSEKPLHSMAI
jgi:oxygen-independent coproporphyrinogen III oxidase